MRKWVAGMAALVMLLSCAGCAGKQAVPVGTEASASSTRQTSSSQASKSEVSTSTSVTTSSSAASTTDEKTQEQTVAPTKATAAKTTAAPAAQLPPLVAGTSEVYYTVENPIKADISARNAIVYDETHDLVLYAKNVNTPCAPASITKVLTAIVACEKVPLDTVFTVGSEIDLVAGAASRAFITKGSRYTLSTLLEALLIPSGCDAAYTIAVNVARTASGNKGLTDRQALQLFVRYMNQAAQDMGATDSQFRCPDGFPTSGHYTTARDLLTIARKARTIPTLRTIMSRSTSSNGRWSGTNALIKSYSGYYYKGATGMKTGTSDEAGNCVMASATKGGISLIVIVMGSAYRYEDAVVLLDKGFAMASKITTTTTTTKTTTTSTTTKTTTSGTTSATSTSTTTTTTTGAPEEPSITSPDDTIQPDETCPGGAAASPAE